MEKEIIKLNRLQFFAIILLFNSTSFGQSIYSKLDSLLTSQHKQREFNGNILISENGKITFEKSYGFADETTNIKLHKNSIFNIASITKQFTATAIVMLKERGQISFDDKIIKYIPELTEYKDISIRALLNHTSGIGDLDNLMDSLFVEEIKKERFLSNSDIIKALVKFKPALISNVGTKYAYSNIGYLLLGTVIERISGMTYATYIRKNIFEPLKMRNSFVYGERIKSEFLTKGHYYDDSLKTVKIANTVLDYQRFKIDENLLGGQGIYSTTGDLLIWIENFTNNKLISKAGFSEMIKRATLNDSSLTDYGLGYELGFWKDFTTTIGHSGRWPGYSCVFEWNPKNEKIIIILQNFNFPNHLSKIKNILYNIKPTVFIELKKYETDKFVGEYKNSSGGIGKIMAENNKLYVQMNPSVKLELRPISKTKFVIIGFQPEVQYEFVEENEKVIKYIIRQPERGILKEAIKM